MYNKNIEHKILSLLDNQVFIQWILYPTEELDLYWKNEIEGDSDLSVCVEILKNTLKKIKVEEPELSDDDKKDIWNKIQLRTNKKLRKRLSVKHWWVKVISVAAILMLLVGTYFYFANSGKSPDINYAALLNDDDSTPSDNISLVLSGDKILNIEDDSTNVTYDQNGRVKVDSEEIETNSDAKSSLNQLNVPYGKMTSLVLSDGTKVFVNSGTKLIYPPVFAKDKREIYLVGEAYFDVAKNKEWPFVIKTDQMDVKVLGTSLNVSAYSDDDRHSVVLVTGAVNVTSASLKGNYNIYPNQMFSFDVKSNKVGIQEVDVDNYTSWVNGYLMLKSQRLDLVLQKLERHYNCSINYNAPKLADIRVSGKLDLRGSLENALKHISLTTPISYSFDDEGITVKYKSKGEK